MAKKMALTEKDIESLFQEYAEAGEKRDEYDALLEEAEKRWLEIHNKLFRGSVEDCRAVQKYMDDHLKGHPEYAFWTLTLKSWIEAEPERRKYE